MAEVVYVLCALTSAACATLLLRAYWRRRSGLLLWSSLSFAAFALNNILLVIDMMIIPHFDFWTIRTSVMLIGFALLLYGLIWEKA